MRALVVTQIFPNARQPEMAPYNRRQFGELSRRCDLLLFALVPWFPGERLVKGPRPPVPSEEQLDGLRVLHPRVLYLPRAAGASGALYTASLLPRALPLRGAIDVVLGAFAYPDGWAAVALGRLLAVPVVIKLHGSDIHRVGDDRALGRRVAWALSHADAVVAPSAPLIERAVALGARPDRARVVMNGIDRASFFPRDRAESRTSLGYAGDRRSWLLFVGRLEREKGVLDLLDAFPKLCERRQQHLVLIGEGRDRQKCERIVQERGLPVSLVGARAPEEVARWLGAADLCVLPSWAEGTPNAVIEAIASGRPVVATKVGGIPALVGPTVGELVSARRPDELGPAIERSLGRPWDAHAIARTLSLGDWRDSAAELHRVLTDAVAARVERSAA